VNRLGLPLALVLALVACEAPDDFERLPACGDGACDGQEACEGCPEDCGACGSCGDGACDPGLEETCAECPEDCGACPLHGECGDGACAEQEGESCATCPPDCGSCPACGDGRCDPEALEDCAACPADCGGCDPCGDEVCAAGETCASCPEDCGRCDPCGDGVCDGAHEDCAACPADCGDCGARPGCVQGDFSVYFGNLHAHTSYSDGERTPRVAFEHAYQEGLDFLWVTDHKGQMLERFANCKAEADLVQGRHAGSFVAGCGYEIVILGADGDALGHFNTLFVGTRIPTPVGLDELYQTVAGCAPCVGQWNHPPWPGTFRNYRYAAAGRPAMRLIEFSGRGDWSDKIHAYFQALRNGWQVSPAMNEDNHQENWGDSPRATGVWAAELTRAGLRDAVRANRTFATQDDTARIAFKADGVCWMGSRLRGGGPLDLSVVAHDRQSGDGFRRVDLLGAEGQVLESKACHGENPCRATFTRHPTDARFWVAQAVQTDGDVLISAPIWFEP